MDKTIQEYFNYYNNEIDLKYISYCKPITYKPHQSIEIIAGRPSETAACAVSAVNKNPATPHCLVSFPICFTTHFSDGLFPCFPTNPPPICCKA